MHLVKENTLLKEPQKEVVYGVLQTYESSVYNAPIIGEQQLKESFPDSQFKNPVLGLAEDEQGKTLLVVNLANALDALNFIDTQPNIIQKTVSDYVISKALEVSGYKNNFFYTKRPLIFP